MKKLTHFKDEPVRYVSTSQVTKGVSCDVYEFVDDTTKDLGIITIQKGCKTPLQEVIAGDKTYQMFLEGKGGLIILDTNKLAHEYDFPEHESDTIEVAIGEKMQWHATDDLVVAEICHPPYQDGRFRNIL